MKFTFIVSEAENLFFFISNLAEWHFSCRSDYNIEWIKTSGRLIPTENGALDDFRRIITKYGLAYKNNSFRYLGQSFFIPEEAKKWNVVECFVTPKEYQLITRIFEVFRPRFKRVWQRNEVMKWQTALERMVKSSDHKHLLADVELFFGLPNYVPSLTIHLLASPSRTRTVAGGANLGKRDVTLEVPVYLLRRWDLEYGIGVLAHELCHLYIDHPRTTRLINSALRKAERRTLSYPQFFGDRRAAIKELIAEICAPRGYPCWKYFETYDPVSDILLPSFAGAANPVNFGGASGRSAPSAPALMKYLIWQSYPVMASYLESRRGIDAKFIRFVDRLLCSV